MACILSALLQDKGPDEGLQAAALSATACGGGAGTDRRIYGWATKRCATSRRICMAAGSRVAAAPHADVFLALATLLVRRFLHARLGAPEMRKRLVIVLGDAKHVGDSHVDHGSHRIILCQVCRL